MLLLKVHPEERQSHYIITPDLDKPFHRHSTLKSTMGLLHTLNNIPKWKTLHLLHNNSIPLTLQLTSDASHNLQELQWLKKGTLAFKLHTSYWKPQSCRYLQWTEIHDDIMSQIFNRKLINFNHTLQVNQAMTCQFHFLNTQQKQDIKMPITALPSLSASAKHRGKLQAWANSRSLPRRCVATESALYPSSHLPEPAALSLHTCPQQLGEALVHCKPREKSDKT